MREALRRLAALGLVSFEPNRGVRVRTLSRDELREAFLSGRSSRASHRDRDAADDATRTSPSSTRPSGASAAHASSCARASRAATGARSRREWVRANHAFHDVIYRAADVPLIERMAKSARRTFSGQAVWAPGADHRRRCTRANDRQHRAIRAGARRAQRRGRARARARARALLVRAARGDPRPGRRPPARLARRQAARSQLTPDGLRSPGRRSGGTGRRAGLKIRCPSGRAGSIPAFGTPTAASGARGRVAVARGVEWLDTAQPRRRRGRGPAGQMTRGTGGGL